MKKLFSKLDFLYLVPPVLTLLMCFLVYITKSQGLAVVNMFITAAGYETATFIIKFYSPYRFRAFDLVKILVSMILVYGIYIGQYFVSGVAAEDMWPILKVMQTASLVVLAVAGPLVMLLKKRREGD